MQWRFDRWCEWVQDGQAVYSWLMMMVMLMMVIVLAHTPKWSARGQRKPIFFGIGRSPKEHLVCHLLYIHKHSHTQTAPATSPRINLIYLIIPFLSTPRPGDTRQFKVWTPSYLYKFTHKHPSIRKYVLRQWPTEMIVCGAWDRIAESMIIRREYARICRRFDSHLSDWWSWWIEEWDSYL